MIEEIFEPQPGEALTSFRESLEIAGHKPDVITAIIQLWTEELMAGLETFTILDPDLTGDLSITIMKG